MQAEGQFAPGCDGWGSRRGGGVGGRRGGSRGHGEATVSTNLAENLTPWSLRPQGADLSDRAQTMKRGRHHQILSHYRVLEVKQSKLHNKSIKQN